MQIVSARSLSAEGARLDGMRHRLRIGDLLEVQNGKRRAEFRVVWVAESIDHRQSQVGIKSLPTENCIWDVNLQLCSEFVGNG
jgi:hypothetical protein